MYKSRTKTTQDSTDDISPSMVLNMSASKEPLDTMAEKDIGTTVIPEQNNNFASTTAPILIVDAQNSKEVEELDADTNTDPKEKAPEPTEDDDNKEEIMNNNNLTETIDDSTVKEYSNNSNNTRTLTQQCSLVAPSEVQVSVSPALTAEPVLTPSGKFFNFHLTTFSK